MTIKQIDRLHDKIKKGVLLAHKRLINSAKKNNDYLIIFKNEKNVRIRAKEIK